jgi:hypothetical protein
MSGIFIQSANALVSRIAQWVGAIPSALSITVSGVAGTSTPVLTTSANPITFVLPGDFIGTSTMLPYTVVLSVNATTITVSDPDGIWANLTYPATILKLPSQSSMEIMTSIQLAELKMRTVELPALRSNPYDLVAPTILTTDSQGMASIPIDMNWPILFFQDSQPQNQPANATNMGPWIIYDRVGDREIIRRRMIDQLYIRPFGVPRVIRASFSEVGGKYIFTPNPGDAVVIKAYYQKTFPFLFGSTLDIFEPITQNNDVLASFPEGYLYATLSAYYDKNKNASESQKWDVRFDAAYGLIQDQNFKDKWRGGDQHLTSEFQPRSYRYSFK